MKEATGEVSMTMITLIGIGVIGGLLALLWPNIQSWITDMFDSTSTNCPAGYTWDADENICKKNAK